MKKFYISPVVNVVDLTTEEGILSGSKLDRFDVGVSNDAMDGSEALSNSKHDIWGTEDIWK